jgi:hypothetical protein
VLGEKASTPALKTLKTNRSGAVKKGARKVRLADAPAGDCAGSQPEQGPSKGRPHLEAAILRSYRNPEHLGSKPKDGKITVAQT